MTQTREAMDAVAPQFPGRQFLAFDALTAAAFVAFRDAGADTQIIEVGLGGRLDSTNVFGDENRERNAERPHVVILTPISLEHTAILGTTIPEIAREKAGVITQGACVVVAPQRESALDVFREVAAERDASIIEVAAACQLTRTAASSEGQEFKLKTPRETYAGRLPLAGRHQLDNAAAAVIACEELAQRAGFELTSAHVREGLAAVTWPGRLEALKRAPYVIVDGAHNGDSAKRMVAGLREHFGLSRAMFLFGTLAGKDIGAMADAVAPAADARLRDGVAARPRRRPAPGRRRLPRARCTRHRVRRPAAGVRLRRRRSGTARRHRRVRFDRLRGGRARIRAGHRIRYDSIGHIQRIPIARDNSR